MKKIIFTLIFGIFLISFISAAVTCSTNNIEKVINEGEIPGSSDSFSCTNNGNSSVTVYKSGSFFSVSETTPFIIGQGSTRGSLSINFNEDSVGNYNGMIYFSDGSEPININLQINEQEEEEDECKLNPTLTYFQQTYQQGVTADLPKITFNPKNCDGTFSIDSAYISGGITTSEGQKPIFIKSSSSSEIVLGVNTVGLSSAPYQSTLTISAFGHTFTDISTINIIVTGGTNPSGDFNPNNLPTCSLTSNILNLNGTYSLVCTGITPGVSIHPKIDSDFIKGLGPGDDMTSTNFVWEFTPIKLGNTNITAEFKYLDLPVGSPFSQETKIQSSSGQTPGTNLMLLFSKEISELLPGEEVIIQLADNKSNSLVESPEIYINSVKLSPLNISDKSFPYSFELGKNYEIRGKSVGYNDLLKVVNLTSQEIQITITPEKEEYKVGDTINITTNVDNSTLLLDNTIIESPYTITSSGVHTIEAKKQDYISSSLNITVKSLVSCQTGCDSFNDAKKGKEVLLDLTEDVVWAVEFEKAYKQDGNVYYEASVNVINGTGKRINFNVEDYGRYVIRENGNVILSKNVEQKLFIEPVIEFVKEYWVWCIAGLVVFGLLAYLIFFKGKNEEKGFGFEKMAMGVE